MTPALVLLGLLACAAAAPLLAGRLDRNAGYPLAAAFAVGAVAIGTQAPRVVAGEPSRPPSRGSPCSGCRPDWCSTDCRC